MYWVYTLQNAHFTLFAADGYVLPYHDKVGDNPSFEAMEEVISVQKYRPPIQVWSFLILIKMIFNITATCLVLVGTYFTLVDKSSVFSALPGNGGLVIQPTPSPSPG